MIFNNKIIFNLYIYILLDIYIYISNIRIFVNLADCLGEPWKRTRLLRRREYFSLKNKSAKDAKGGDSRTCDEIERIVLYPLLESRVFLPCIFDTVRVLFVNYFYERCACQRKKFVLIVLA